MKRLFSILLITIILASSMGCGYKTTITELKDDIAALDGQVISLF